ncbi:hypothetical protein [Halorubrum sp. AJ67]|uniref:hypothetical protein n=1 Tax=Halorubrum sp. AJ67 TaxID=1173487 RepID=UPI0003DB83F0|nr:hypothetical protein [Halorubrum sp. AJ67]CDK37855.1 uncharacterized protein BN903_55 [Halorubrum sp. AJ67]
MTTSHDTSHGASRSASPNRTGLNRFRSPEYTGENRCLPCTAVNVGIAGVLAVAVGVVVAVELGVFAFVASLAAIWLRGYLVPGTPELTKRYLPERVLRLFGKGRASSPPTALDAESYLLSSSVLVDTPDGVDLAFAPWFASAWRSELAALRAGDSDDDGPSREADEATDGPDPDIAALAALTDIDAELLAIDWRDGAAFARADGERIGHWESRAAFLADIAADRALADELDDWNDLQLAARSGVLGAIRLFVEECPACEGAVALEERVVESCCTRYDVVAGRCTACNERLFEMDLPPSVAAESA